MVTAVQVLIYSHRPLRIGIPTFLEYSERGDEGGVQLLYPGASQSVGDDCRFLIFRFMGNIHLEIEIPFS